MTPQQQAEVFEAYFSGLYDWKSLEGDSGGFKVRAMEVAVSDWRFSAIDIQDDYHLLRDAARIRRDSCDGVTIGYHLRGRNLIDDDGVERPWVPGSLLLVDMVRPNRYAFGRGANVRLRLPRAVAEELRLEPERAHNVVRSDLVARLLGEYLKAFMRHARLNPDEPAAGVIEQVKLMLPAALSARRDDLVRAAEPINERLYARACRHIDRELLSETLTPDSLAAAVGVSRRKLYQLFEPSGGVAKAILARRLDHAHSVLEDVRAFHSVKEVAYSHGFASDAHFARCFKQKFGYRPGEAAERAAQSAA